MKILSYQVHNILKVSDLDLSMNGRNLVLIGGSNGQGKTSAIKALLMALCGKSGMNWPDIVLKEGETEGSVVVELSGDSELHDLSGFTVELIVTKERDGSIKQKINVIDSTGDKAPEPRTLLKRLYNLRGFDPLAFEKSKPKDRLVILRDLLGLSFEDLDDRRATAYASRTVTNTEGTRKKAQLDSLKSQFNAPDDLPNEPLSVSDMVDQLREAEAHNTGIANQKASLESLLKKESAFKLEESKLKERLAEIDEARIKLDHAISDIEVTLSKAKPIDTAPIQESIKNAGEINKMIDTKLQIDSLSEELERLRAVSKSYSDEISQVDEEKQERIQNAKFPLPNLSLDDSGVLLDGLPFEQASKAQRVVASVKIGMAMNPKLRLLVCEDGNDLDDATMQALSDTLKDNDFQMLLEYVTRSPEDESKCAVVFTDGQPTYH